MASKSAEPPAAAPQWRPAIDLSTIPEGGSGSGAKGEGAAAPAPRKRPPKFEPHFLCDEEKGLPKLYRMAASVDVYSGRGHEVADMSRLMSLYRSWATRVYPHMQFDHVMDRVDAFGHKMVVKVSRGRAGGLGGAESAVPVPTPRSRAQDTLTQLRARERERIDNLNRPVPESGAQAAAGPEAAAADQPAGPSASDAFDAITGTVPSGGGSSGRQEGRPPAQPAASGDDTFMAEVEQALADEAAARQRAGPVGGEATVGRAGQGGSGEGADVGFEEEWEALNDM